MDAPHDITFLALIGQAVPKEKIFENGGRRRTTTDATGWTDTIRLSCEPDGSGEVKRFTKAFSFTKKTTCKTCIRFLK